MATDWCR